MLHIQKSNIYLHTFDCTSYYKKRNFTENKAKQYFRTILFYAWFLYFTFLSIIEVHSPSWS